jgi:outer membrane protein assembly factor BamB
MSVFHSPSRIALALFAAIALSSCGTASAVGAKLWPFHSDGAKKDKAKEAEEGRISILTFDQKLAPDPALAGRAPEIPAPIDVTEWPEPGGSQNNAPIHVNGSADLKVDWREGAGQGSSRQEWIAAPPVIADGKLFLLDAGQELRALDANSGKHLWSASLKPKKSHDKNAVGGGVAYGDGRVYVASGYGGIVAFDPNTGKQLWRSSTVAPFRAAPTAGDGRVFAVTNDSELVALDGSTGEVLWTHQAISEPAGILSASSPALSADMVIAPFNSGEVVALLAANGRRLWVDALTRNGRLTSLSAINDIAGRPVAADGVVYAVSHSGVMVAIDQRSGQRIWARGIASTQTPWVAGDAVYIVTTDGELAALDRNTGGAFWVTQLQRYEKEKDKKGRVTWTGPIMVGGNLVLASSEGEAVLVSPASGQINKTIKLGAPVFIPPIAANGAVYLVNSEAKLVVLR